MNFLSSNNKINILIAILFVLFFVECGSNNAPTQEFESKEAVTSLSDIKHIIDSTNVIYMKAFLSGDSVLFSSLHHSMSINMPPNDLTKNYLEMGSLVRYSSIMNIKHYIVKSLEVFGGPNEYIERGIYEAGMDSTKIIEKGKYIVIWKKENSAWKIYRSIWNSDLIPTNSN